MVKFKFSFCYSICRQYSCAFSHDTDLHALRCKIKFIWVKLIRGQSCLVIMIHNATDKAIVVLLLLNFIATPYNYLVSV